MNWYNRLNSTILVLKLYEYFSYKAENFIEVVTFFYQGALFWSLFTNPSQAKAFYNKSIFGLKCLSYVYKIFT